MAQGFKVADAYVQVHTDDDTKRGRQQIERDTSRWASALGLRIGNILGRSLGMTVARTLTGTLQALFQISKWMIIAAAVGAAVQAVAALVVGLGKLVGLAPLVVPAVLSMVSAFAALKIAFTGLGAAIQAGWRGDVEKLAEAMKKLHPEAQKLVKTLLALKPQLEAFKKAIQGAFFKDLSKEIQALSVVYLPLLQGHLSAVAGIFNQFVASFLRWLMTKSVVDDWKTTFASLEGVLHNVLSAMLSVLDGFRHIGVVAAPILLMLTQGLARAAQGFAESMARARENGSIEQFIMEALQVGRQLFDLLRNIWAILSPIFHALATGEGNVLELMVRLTGQLADLLSTAQATDAIVALFGALNAIVVALGPGVVALLGGLAKALLAAAPGLTALAMFISEGLVQLAPVLPMVGAMLAQVLQALGPILPLLAQTIGALVTILGPALVQLAPVITDLFGAVASALLPVAGILADLVTALGPSVVQVVLALADALAALVPAAAPVGQALAQVLLALAPLLPVLGQELALILIALAPVLKELAALVGPVVIAATRIMAHVMERLLPVVLDLAERAGPLLVEMFDLLMKVLEPFIPVFIQIADIFINQLIQYIPQFTDIAMQLIPILAQVALLFSQYLLQAIVAILPFLPELIGMGLQLVLAFMKMYVALAPLLPVFIQLLLMFQQLFIQSGLLQAGLNILLTVIGGITAVIWALTEVFKVVVSVATWFKDRIVEVGNIVISIFKGIWDWVSGIGKKLRDSFGTVGDELKNAGRNVVEGFWNGLSAAGGWLAGKVKNFVKDNVVGVFKSVLQLGSPSKVAAELGHWVPIGVAQGMDSQRQSVVDAATRLAMAALPALQVPTGQGQSAVGAATGDQSQRRGDIYVLADFGDGVRQLVKATITDEPQLVAASTDEGRRERGFTYTPRARS